MLASVCLALVACTGRVDLIGAIGEDEANEVLAALLKADVSAQKVPGKDGMVALRVNSDQVSKALLVLSQNGLPRERHAGMGAVFKKEGLISSPLEERARYIYALSQELSATLARIDGVLHARVHVVLPERGPVGETGVSSTAAVFLKHRKEFDLELLQPQIRRLVTNSIPGLAPDRVSIVLVPSHLTSESTPVGVNQATVLGFHVSPDSATGLAALIWTLVIGLFLALGGVGALLWRYVLPRTASASSSTAAPALAMEDA